MGALGYWCLPYDCDRLVKSANISMSLIGGTIAHGDQNGAFLIFLGPTKFHTAWDTGACLRLMIVIHIIFIEILDSRY